MYHWPVGPVGLYPVAGNFLAGAASVERPDLSVDFHLCIFEGSLEVNLPTIWRDEKAVSREKSQKRKDQKKEDAGARKGRKVAKHCVFSWFCGSGGSKVGSLKRRVRRHLGR